MGHPLPDLPVIAERTQAWQSVWQEHDRGSDDKAGRPL